MLATLSPMLTLTWLWQLKEWRWDRLREHIAKEGVFSQLIGTSRAGVLCAYTLILSVALVVSTNSVLSLASTIAMGTLTALACIGCGQWIVKKQRSPRWTAKVIIIVSLAFCSCAFSLFVLFSAAKEVHQVMLVAPLLPFFTPLYLALAWLTFLPVDRWMKKRLFSSATLVRSLHPHMTVIGITGSVGKTTTKELLAHILYERHPMVTPAHVNTDTGVSQWLLHALRSIPHDEKRIMIVEMGAYRMGEIALLASIAQPSIGIITRIGEEHLGLFGSREAITKAKGELFVSLPQSGCAFLNADDEASRTLASYCTCETVRVSTGSDGDIRAINIEERDGGVHFTVEGHVMKLSIPGTHNISNALLAIACAHHLGMSLRQIAQRLPSFTLQANTFNVREERGITLLDATYNSSPQSVEAAITWAHAQPHKNKVLLMSGIIELGAEEYAIHTMLARQACHIFSRAYVLSERFRKPIAEGGFGARVSVIGRNPEKLLEGSLLICIGRVSSATIRSLLP